MNLNVLIFENKMSLQRYVPLPTAKRRAGHVVMDASIYPLCAFAVRPVKCPYMLS